jgi:hypothetical protein
VRLWYDEKRPWHVPGLELLSRKWYPEGWDDYVNKGIKPVRRSTSLTKVVETPGFGGSAGPQPAVPVTETESEQLLAAKQKLKAAEEAKEIRELEARHLALELEAQEAKTAKLAMKLKLQELERKREEAAAIEAAKAEIQAAAKKTGQHGFGNASTSKPSTNEGLNASIWNVEGKQSKTAISGKDEFPPLESKPASQEKPRVVTGGTTAPPATGETEAQRQQRIFGWTTTIEKKPVGSRQGMGRGPIEFMVATLRRKWVTHFYGHKKIVQKIKSETQCELISDYDGTGVICTVNIHGKDRNLFSNVQKAHEMMLVYCEDIQKQDAKEKKELEKKTASKADILCHGCGLPGHIRAQCPIPSECWNCGEIGHVEKMCPEPPIKGPQYWNCGGREGQERVLEAKAAEA